jgi:malate dehydrogenase (oxaloacetate-decarboxylating)(NADP+)
MRRRHSLIGAMMIHKGDADGMICGTFGTHDLHLHYVDHVIGKRAGVANYYAMNLLMLPHRTVFICDTYVNDDPTPEQLLEMTRLAAEEIRRFGLAPKVALLSHSSFGTSNAPSARKMRATLEIIRARMPELEIEGEMHGDAALSEEVRLKAFPNSRLKGDANLLDHADAGCRQHLVQPAEDRGRRGHHRGPILLGAAKPVHILTPTATVRRIINMTALAVVDAQELGKGAVWV